jgi:hypothetical protein
MDLGMFDRFYPSLKTRALIDERRIDMSRYDKNSERYVIPMHRKNVWTKKGCKILEIFFCRLATIIIACSTKKAGYHLKEREDQPFVIVVEDRDILLRNALGKDLVVFVVKLWTMKCWIALECLLRWKK